MSVPSIRDLDDHVIWKTCGICNQCEGARMNFNVHFQQKQIGPRKELDIIFSLSSPFKGSVIVQCAIVVPMVHSWFSLLSNGIF